jgi:3-dehydroquinate synthetase
VVLGTRRAASSAPGLYEVIKYGRDQGAALLDRMRDSTTAIFNRDADAVAPLVTASCRIKAEVVSPTSAESGLRRILTSATPSAMRSKR